MFGDLSRDFFKYSACDANACLIAEIKLNFMFELYVLINSRYGKMRAKGK